jgi:hypothetical protein
MMFLAELGETKTVYIPNFLIFLVPVPQLVDAIEELQNKRCHYP